MTSSLCAFTMSPSTRILGRSPATRWMSEASFSIISSSNARRLIGMLPLLSGCGFFDDFFERSHALLDLQHPVHAQREHAFFDREVAQLFGRGTLQDLSAQRARQRHHFVQSLPAAVTGAGAGITPRAFEEGAYLLVDPEGV